jgi:hypothetical protein
MSFRLLAWNSSAPTGRIFMKFHSWVISEVLHTVCFLLKNEFILQNTFTGLQCNLHWRFITVVQRLGKSCIPVCTPSLLKRLITQVTSLDTFSMLLKHFPRNKSKSGGLSPPDFDLFPKLKKPLRGKRLRSIDEVT